jgi:hypothetical protein
MKKRNAILFIGMILIVLVYFVPQISFDKTTNEARSLIRKHAGYINNKDWEAYTAIADKLLVPVPHHIKTIDNVKILWIINSKKKVTARRLGREVPIYDSRVFKVVYYIKNKSLEDAETYKRATGIVIDNVVIVKETKESPWLFGPLGAYK